MTDNILVESRQKSNRCKPKQSIILEPETEWDGNLWIAKYISASAKPTRKRAKCKPPLTIAIDSEWDTRLAKPWLSSVFTSDIYGTTLYLKTDLSEVVKAVLYLTAKEMGIDIEFVEREDNTSLLELYRQKYGIDNPITLIMFYSPKDLEYALGSDRFLKSCNEKLIRQRGNVSGRIIGDNGRKIVIKDVFGLSNESLEKTLASMGFDTTIKKLVVGIDKGKMSDFLVNDPANYLRYSAGDGTTLLELRDKFVAYFREVQLNTLGMKQTSLWNTDNIPMTVGSLVARTFEKWIHGNAFDDDVFNFCLRKIGMIDANLQTKQRDAALRGYTKSVHRYHDIETLQVGFRCGDPYLKTMLRSKYMVTGMDACSVKWFASREAENSVIHNALIQGGRCNNERPSRYRIVHGADIDISSCYGEALRSMAYPIGVPRCWGNTPTEVPETFGDWLDRNKGELVSGLWTCTVSGKLDFAQDLLFSKLVTPADIRKAARSQDDPNAEDGDIEACFVLQRHEITNAIITHDLLVTILKASTEKEIKGIRNLKVISAAAYMESDRCEDMESWCSKVLASKGCAYNHNGQTVDERTKAWFSLPLEAYIGKLVDRRKAVKKSIKLAKTPEERMALEAESNILKLLVNVMYGSIASRFFLVGNTVVGNNITALARNGTWMMSKALGCQQVITDGGCYTPGAVRFFTGKKPGLETLAQVDEWHCPRNHRWERPLPGFDWDTSVSEIGLATIDKCASDHIKEFWKPYDIPFAFGMEHKCLFNVGAFFNKADYALRPVIGKPVYKLRGVDTENENHPKIVLLNRILDGDDTFPEILTYTTGGIMTIPKYVAIQKSNGFKNLKHLRPGDSLPLSVRTLQLNNAHININTEAEYRQITNRKRTKGKDKLSLFERFGPDGIDVVHDKMLANDLRMYKSYK